MIFNPITGLSKRRPRMGGVAYAGHTEKTRHNTRKRLLAVALLIIFYAPTGLVILTNHRALALDTQAQTNWAGGVGSSTTNQYAQASGINTSNAGHITITGDSTNWCNSGSCNAGWSRRQIVRIGNYQNDAYSNRNVKVYVPYDSDMQTDFDDIRFVDDTGLVDFSYYRYTKTDSEKAEFIVTIPTISGYGVTSMYMYYGNNAASSTTSNSVVTIQNDFQTEPLSAQWSAEGPVDISPGSLSGGEFSFNDAYLFSSVSTFDRSVDRAYEFDIKAQVSDVPCGEIRELFGIYTSPSYISKFRTPNSCDETNTQYYKTNDVYEENSSTSSTITNSPRIYNDYVRIKYIAYTSGGADYFISTNGGQRYTKLDASILDDTSDSKIRINSYANAPTITLANPVSYSAAPVDALLGVEEYQGGKTGILLANFFDQGSPQATYGNMQVTSTGTGNMVFYPVTSSSASLTLDPRLCPSIQSGQAFSNSVCAPNQRQYATYYAEFATDSSATLDITSIGFEYESDFVAPTNASNLVVKTAPAGVSIADNAWTSTSQPYASWTAGSDNPGGSGIAGYCIYFGTNEAGDPADSKGAITASSPIETNGACEYAVSSTNFNSGADQIGSLTHGQTYYVRVRAVDNFGNLSATTLSSRLRLDTSAPSSATLYNAPTVINSKRLRVTWLTGGSVGDEDSGVAGYKYCVSTLISGFDGCSYSSQNWYGSSHTSGILADTSDVVPFSAGELTTVAADDARIDDAVAGVNSITVALVDNAGNPSTVLNQVFLITYVASDAPQNLTVSPTSSSTNQFAFQWDPPSTLFGATNQTDYCWTVNEEIESDGSNCNYTGAGITQLAAGPYATQQGLNTFRIATKDMTGNFDSSKHTSITFTATTTAPGIPQDIELADVSIRATSAWKIAISWTPPSSPGSGIASYKILRSTDNSTFSEVGSTAVGNTSFVDAGLSQLDYYYKVKACDNAGSCSAPSASATRKPTGRYTEPARLTADSDQPKERDITTRSATVYWFTDRESDSRIALGTSPGTYAAQEIGNSTQTASHSVNLSNLEAGKTYYYIAKWTDDDGNTGQSQEHSFRTLPAPSFKDVSPDNLTVSSTSVKFTVSSASKVKLYYGKNESFGAIKQIDVSNEESTYAIDVSELDDGVKYYFKLNGLDNEGNEYQGDVYSFTTPARPRISDLAINTVEGESSSTKVVTWKTNVPANSAVTFKTSNGAAKDLADSVLKTDHSITIRGLEDSSDYSLFATSRDAAGNTATSETRTFRTSEDTRPPKISDISIESSVRGSGSEARGQIIVSWKTDEPATSQVAFGQGEAGKLTSRTARDDRLSLEHTVVISDLPTSSIFQIQPISADKAGNGELGDTQTAIIGRASENVFSLIFNALQKIFGIGN